MTPPASTHVRASPDAYVRAIPYDVVPIKLTQLVYPIKRTLFLDGSWRNHGAYP